MVLAWHFAGSQMRDGTPLGAPGETEEYEGEVRISESGLHASERLIDALDYAPGALLRRVECLGVVDRQADKLVCRRRRVLWECDITGALRLFARKCALDVAHLWDMPPIVREYLMTGNEDAARDAAWDAAWDAARDAARDAAWDAARGAARAAAWDAARDAAWDAARAARAAAWDAQDRRLVAYAQAARCGR